MIRLVALDVDGTLLNRDGQVTPRVRRALARLAAHGIPFTLATGRSYRGTRELVRELGIRLPFVVQNGAALIDPSGRLLEQRLLPAEQALQLYHLARGAGLDPWMVGPVDEGEPLLADAATPPPAFPPPGGAASPPRVLKLWAAGPPARVVSFARQARRYLGQAGRVIVYRGPERPVWLAEVLEGQAGKGRAVAAIARQLGIAREEVLAIGDGVNDVDLLRFAGTGLAVAGAPPVVRRVASAVVEGAESDAVAEALERYVLGAAF